MGLIDLETALIRKAGVPFSSRSLWSISTFSRRLWRDNIQQQEKFHDGYLAKVFFPGPAGYGLAICGC
ncbi:hypothetical protein XENTR_v10019635 [Xenopus tropicalis]|nr:hypothetical protein XENTR_v10019635 [Xenopus tropicalis]